MKQLPAAVWMRLVVPNLIHFTFIFKFTQLKYRLKFSSGTSCLGEKFIFSEILTTLTRKINEKLLVNATKGSKDSVTQAKRPVRDLCVFPNQLLSGCWLSWSGIGGSENAAKSCRCKTLICLHTLMLWSKSCALPLQPTDFKKQILHIESECSLFLVWIQLSQFHCGSK